MERIAEGISEQIQSVRRLTSRSVVSFAIRLFIGIAILFILFQFVSIKAILQALQQAQADFIVLALVMLIANIGLQVWKWHYLLRLGSPQVSIAQSIGSFLFGVTLGSFTPGQLGEFGGRAVGHQAMHPLKVIHFTLIDKFQILLVIFMGGIAACTFFFVPLFWQGITTMIVSTTILLFLFFRPLTLKPLAQFILPKKVFTKWFNDFFEALALLNLKGLVYTFILTLLFYAVLTLQMYLLLNAFFPVDGLDAFLGFAAMMFTKTLLPISLADIGIREAGSVYFYGKLGIPESAALNASLLLFTINILLPSIIGLFFLPRFTYRNKKNNSGSETA